jgi:hypothetical protein
VGDNDVYFSGAEREDDAEHRTAPKDRRIVELLLTYLT